MRKSGFWGLAVAFASGLFAQTTIAQPTLPGVTPLQSLVNAEAEARAAGDTQLQNAINAEAAARALGDATLLGAINAEAEARKAAIQALQEQPTGATRCYGVHFVRGVAPGDEIQFSVIFFNNADLANAATVQRVTIRDDLGVVIHDSGPRTVVPHPLATAPIPAIDITTVPPGATYGLSTTDIWGFNTIPSQIGRGTRSLSITAEVTKAGDPKLLSVHARQIVRQRFVSPTPPFVFTGLGAERSNTDSTCFSVLPQ